MGVGWSGSTGVPSSECWDCKWASQTGPRTHQSVQELRLDGDLVEQLGELLCQDAVPAGEHKN